MRSIARALVALTVLVGVAADATGADPAAATVLIRVQGDVTVALGADARVWRQSVERREVQIATGSGFIISPTGYILTNSHVLRGGRHKLLVEGQPVDVTLSVTTVYVVIAAPSGDTSPPRTIEATVVADDPEVDLAILSIAGQDLPVAPIGDTIALQRGDPVWAWGYPLGDRLAVESPDGSEVPPVSASAGTVAVLREGGAAGLPATVPYVQFTAPINPGNSGGPLTDRDGNVVGVVQAKVRQAEGVAFAIAIEEVKRFLERTGIDATLPVVRLALGPAFDFADKGIRMRVPVGFADVSTSRTRIDSASSLAPLQLTVDRVATPWDAVRMERALLEESAFSSRTFTRLADRVRGDPARAHVRIGLAAQLGENDNVRMLHALVDTGEDVVVARYVASPADVAYNLSVLRESLLSIEAVTLAARPVAAALSVRMVPTAETVSAPPVNVLPADTLIDGAVAAGCRGLAAPERSIVATAASDFTIRFVASRWPAGASPADVARACVGPTATRGTLRASMFGLDWVGERAVATTPDGAPVLLEVWAPAAKIAAAREAFRAWERAVSAQRP